MASNLFSAILFMVFSLSFSQTSKDGKIFLDSTWSETTEANHKYYRIIKDYYSDKDSYKIYDYFKSGVLQMVGTSKFKDHIQKEGPFVYYYENGNKESIETYVNGTQTGKQYYWYQNGNKKSEIHYFTDIETKSPTYNIIQYWDINGNQKLVDGNGEYEIESDDLHEIGTLVKSLKHGTWKGKITSAKHSFIEKYEEGNLISGISTDSNGINYSYTSLTTAGGPKKGLKHFYFFISRNFMKPKEAKTNNFIGTVYLTFTIEKEGSASNIEVIRKVGYGIDEEAVRLVKSYKGWTPFKRRGIIEPVLYSLPIKIK
jgi:hypothetical protein